MSVDRNKDIRNGLLSSRRQLSAKVWFPQTEYEYISRVLYMWPRHETAKNLCVHILYTHHTCLSSKASCQQWTTHAERSSLNGLSDDEKITLGLSDSSPEFSWRRDFAYVGFYQFIFTTPDLRILNQINNFFHLKKLLKLMVRKEPFDSQMQNLCVLRHLQNI